MIDEPPDDTIEQYVPAKGRRKAGVTITSDTAGIVVHASIGNGALPQEPTRYALALRRQASNRARRVAGNSPLPSIDPGPCPDCSGWGVRGGTRQRCSTCHGSGG